jgi:glutamine---fructose-6-phosphate transaminase (isomerizing)
MLEQTEITTLREIYGQPGAWRTTLLSLEKAGLQQTLIGALISQAGFAEETAVLAEMKELRGATFAISNAATPALREAADLLIVLNLPVPETVWLPVYIVGGHLFGSYHGLAKGLNPDQPRHLSRVVVL